MEHGGQREGTAHLPTNGGLAYCGGMVTTWCWWWWRAGGGAREDRTGGGGKMSERRPIVFFLSFWEIYAECFGQHSTNSQIFAECH
jgi:hypothetical protein